jgi:hypothetical protein
MSTYVSSSSPLPPTPHAHLAHIRTLVVMQPLQRMRDALHEADEAASRRARP